MNIQDIIIRRRLFRKEEEELLPGLLFHSDDPTNTLHFTNWFENDQGNLIDEVITASSPIEIHLKYSIDDAATWTDFVVPAGSKGIDLPVQGTDILLRGKNTGGLSNVSTLWGGDWRTEQGTFHIRPTKPTAVIGNMQWIIDCDNPTSIVPPQASSGVGGSLSGLFSNAHNIIDIDELIIPYKTTSFYLCKSMFVNNQGIKRVQRKLCAWLNNPSCTVLEERCMETMFAGCKSLDYCDLQFYNIKEIKARSLQGTFGGVPFRDHIVYDAFKNIEIGHEACFRGLYGEGWMESDIAGRQMVRGHDLPRIYGTTGTTRRNNSDVAKQLYSEAFSHASDGRLRYVKCLSTHIVGETGYDASLPYYCFVSNMVATDGIFVKYWADSWKQNTTRSGYKQSGVPIGWKVLSCKPFYETTSGVDEYCIANSSTDTTWHDDKKCDEYGNLI